MNRLSIRLTAAAAGLAAGLVVTGCSAGQITQTSTQQSGVNGTAANVGTIALRNVHLQSAQTGDFLKPGRTVPLVFVAANESPDTADKLVRVTSDVGEVKITGDTSIPALEALVTGVSGAAEPMGATTPTTVDVALAKPITNGLTYNFTFEFERAGKATVAVPIAAGEG